MRKDELVHLWLEIGEPQDAVPRIMQCLTLSAHSVSKFEASFETPVPYYIDMGRDAVLLPVFGALLNAHAGLVWALRADHRNEWNNAAKTRERQFREELQALFPEPRFEVLGDIVLKREDGSTLTDIDAVLIDTDRRRTRPDPVEMVRHCRVLRTGARQSPAECPESKCLGERRQDLDRRSRFKGGRSGLGT